MLICLFALSLAAVALYGHCRKLRKRVSVLERNLQEISAAMYQMAYVEIASHAKFSSSLSHIEERLLELSVPSQESNLPLERRHQVLSLARQGMGLEEIVHRLNAPVGEAELILNLGKYMDGEKRPGNMRCHA